MLEISALATLWITLMCSVLHWYIDRTDSSARTSDAVAAVMLTVNFAMLLAFVTAIVSGAHALCQWC